MQEDSEDLPRTRTLRTYLFGGTCGMYPELLLKLWQVELADLLLHVLVEGGLPELLVCPHRVLLHTGVRKLNHARAQFLEEKMQTFET